MTLQDVKATYTSRLRELELAAGRDRLSKLPAATFFGLYVSLMIVLAVAAMELASIALASTAAVVLVVTLFCAQYYRRTCDALHKTLRIQQLYENGKRRLKDEWAGRGMSGLKLREQVGTLGGMLFRNLEAIPSQSGWDFQRVQLPHG